MKKIVLTYLLISLLVLTVLIVIVNFSGSDKTTDQVGESAGFFNKLKQIFGVEGEIAVADDIDEDDEIFEIGPAFGSDVCPPDGGGFLFEGENSCQDFADLEDCLLEEAQNDCPTGVVERVLCSDDPDAHLPGDPEASCASMTNNGNQNSVQCEGGEGSYEIGFFRCILEDDSMMEEGIIEEDPPIEEVPVDDGALIEEIEEILAEEEGMNNEVIDNEVIDNLMEDGFF